MASSLSIPQTDHKNPPVYTESGFCGLEKLRANQFDMQRHVYHVRSLGKILSSRNWKITVPLNKFPRDEQLKFILRIQSLAPRTHQYVVEKTRDGERPPRIEWISNGDSTLVRAIQVVDPLNLPKSAIRWVFIHVGGRIFQFSACVLWAILKRGFTADTATHDTEPTLHHIEGLPCPYPRGFLLNGQYQRGEHDAFFVHFPKGRVTHFMGKIHGLIRKKLLYAVPDLKQSTYTPQYRILPEPIITTRCFGCSSTITLWDPTYPCSGMCGSCCAANQREFGEAISPSRNYGVFYHYHSILGAVQSVIALSDFNAPCPPANYQNMCDLHGNMDTLSAGGSETDEKDSVDIESQSRNREKKSTDIFWRCLFRKTTPDNRHDIRRLISAFKRREPSLKFSHGAVEKGTDKFNCRLCLEVMRDGREAGIFCVSCLWGIHEVHTVGDPMERDRECVQCVAARSPAPNMLGFDKGADTVYLHCPVEDVYVMRHQEAGDERSRYYYYCAEDAAEHIGDKLRRFNRRLSTMRQLYTLYPFVTTHDYGQRKNVQMVTLYDRKVPDKDRDSGFNLWSNLATEREISDFDEAFDSSFEEWEIEEDEAKYACNYVTNGRWNMWVEYRPENAYRHCVRSE